MHNGRAKIWAWTASISLHTAILIALAEIESPLPGRTEKTIQPSIGRIEQIKLLADSPVKPAKPKIKYKDKSYHFATQANLPQTEPLGPIHNNIQTEPTDLSSKARLKHPSLQSNIPAQSKTDGLFPIAPDQRWICFIVDCSGSMKGLFDTVRAELLNSIEALQQDQYFTIIFFGNDRALMFEGGNLARASRNAKSKAVKFINSIEPAGSTNALIALEKLRQIHEQTGRKPLTVFFLTDGFDLIPKGNTTLTQNIVGILGEYTKDITINTIGFWADESDWKTLMEIAKQTGGSFTHIGNGTNKHTRRVSE